MAKKCTDVSEIEEAGTSARGVIVKMSPVKFTKSGSRYFDGELSDGRSRKRFVSFDTKLRGLMEESFESREAVSFENCHVKRSKFSKNGHDDLEILLSSVSKVQQSHQSFDIPEEEFSGDLVPLCEVSEVQSCGVNSRMTLVVKVVHLDEVSTVKKKNGVTMGKRDGVIGDSSCAVRLVLWNEDVNKLVVGKCYKLSNICIRRWQVVNYVSLSSGSAIEDVEDIGDVVSEVMCDSGFREVEGEIVAISSIVMYLACCLCEAKVVEEDDIGICNKCNSVVKLSKCSKNVIVEFILIVNEDNKKVRVKAFTDVVKQLVGGELNVKEMSKQLLLLDCSNIVFLIDNTCVVKEIKFV